MFVILGILLRTHPDSDECNIHFYVGTYFTFIIETGSNNFYVNLQRFDDSRVLQLENQNEKI